MAHVLIVDDEHDLAELIDFNLRTAGFTTHVATTGEAALAAAREQRPDLVLLEEVWGLSSSLETRTIDTHVMRLRDKLGPARSLLETVRGVGYRIVDPSAA